MITAEAKLAGVMGWPVAHSISPLVHNYWLQLHGIDGAYIPLPVRPEHLQTSLRALPCMGFTGVNLTLPHKAEAVAWVDRIDETARIVGAINTVTIDRNGKLVGSNNDVFGFCEHLRQGIGNLAPYLKNIVLLGAGGAARGICHGLVQLGADTINVVNRTAAHADAVAKISPRIKTISWEERERKLESATMLVNTTSLGMQGKPRLEIKLEALPKDALVTDIVYRPLITLLLKEATERGNPTLDGLGMLLHQAVPAFEAWFGVKPQVNGQVRELATRALA